MTETLLEPLELVGFDAGWARELEEHPGLLPARVLVAEKYNYLLQGPKEIRGKLSGPLRKLAHLGERPVAGDWVVYRPLGDEVLIEAVLPRRSKFSRQRPRSAQEQVLAANADYVFLVMSLTEDFNGPRLERYLAAGRQGGTDAVVVLTKSDRVRDVSGHLSQLAPILAGAPAHVVSNRTGEGLGELERYLGRGRTVALLGSSGVGKSTLANSLLGVDLATNETRADGRGRHTTTQRQLLVTDRGCLLDTPGLRELALFEPEGEAFDDVEGLALECRFSDCRHQTEPDCAVLAAVEAGQLERRRLDSWRKLNQTGR